MPAFPGRRAKKSLGQHFLTDPNLQRKIADAIQPEASDHVVEIGPGTGLLTRHLAGRVARLVLVELDDALAAELAHEYGERPDVEVHHADALETPIAVLAGADDYKVVGNIPYGITSPLIFHLMEQEPRPRLIALTVQKEVADRLTAEPGTKDYGALTVGVRAVAEVERLFKISRAAFRPRPDVDSLTVRITPARPPALSKREEEALRRLTSACFSRRRKQLQKVLRQAPEYALSNAEVTKLLAGLVIDPSLRPDRLPIADYLRLARALEVRGE